MKSALIAVLIFLTLWVNGQSTETFECGTTPTATQDVNLSQLGGIYITSLGELRVLMVFVRFPDDNDPHPYWPAGQPPLNMDNFVDPDLQTGTQLNYNLTYYFDVMSRVNPASQGVFAVVGEEVYVEAPQPRSNYPSRFDAVKDILQNAVDPIVDFALYDNWKRNGNYDHENTPDSVIDMIFMIYRGSPWGTYGGEASLGGAGNSASFTVESGSKVVKVGYPLFSNVGGSGVTIHYPSTLFPTRIFKANKHELGHWLLGQHHPYGLGAPSKSLWGILASGFSSGACANSYERERLAWITPIEITSEVINAPIDDYLNSGTVYKYKPSGGAPNEWYYFENHQQLNVFDDASINSSDKGIYVIHQQDIYNSSNNIKLNTADGNWDWESPYSTSACFSTSFNAYKHLNTNLQGVNHRSQLRPSIGAAYWWLNAYVDPNDNLVCGAFYRGQNVEGAYNASNANVFSPYSNPNTNTWNNTTTNFAAEVTGQSGDVINVHFYYNNAVNASPAKILDVTV